MLNRVSVFGAGAAAETVIVAVPPTETVFVAVPNGAASTGQVGQLGHTDPPASNVAVVVRIADLVTERVRNTAQASQKYSAHRSATVWRGGR